MSSLPITDWHAALDRMELALASATKALARAEERWEMAIAPSAGDGEPPAVLNRLDARLSEWEVHLHAAKELVESAERELAERTAAVEQWRSRFARWTELVQQQENTSPAL